MQIDDIFSSEKIDGEHLIGLKVPLSTAYLCLARGDLKDFPDMELMLAQLIIMTIIDNRKQFDVAMVQSVINSGAENMIRSTKEQYANDPRVRTAMMTAALLAS